MQVTLTPDCSAAAAVVATAVAAAEAAAREAIEKRADAEADVLRQLDESAALLERLLVEQVPLMSTDEH
jgi:hypothetical protein